MTNLELENAVKHIVREQQADGQPVGRHGHTIHA